MRKLLSDRGQVGPSNDPATDVVLARRESVGVDHSAHRVVRDTQKVSRL